MLKFLWRIVPDNYKFSVAFKKIGVIAGKAVTGLLVGSVVGSKLAPQHVEAVGTVVTVLTTACLEAVHDWAKVKWPDNKWL